VNRRAETVAAAVGLAAASDHDGLTDVSNLVLLCSRCHHDLHHGRHTITMSPAGIPELHTNRGPPIQIGA
jgi:predicted HNH restriction endonuclease